MNKDDIAARLYNEWKRKTGARGYLDELPGHILEIEPPVLKRLYIVFYFTTLKIVQFPSASEEVVLRLESLPYLPEKNIYQVNWRGPLDRLNPIAIANSTPKEIKHVLRNKITIVKAKSLKELAIWITETGDIPRTHSSLLDFSCISAISARRIMYYAWGDQEGAIVTNAMVTRVLYRLGWVDEIEAKSLKEARSYMRDNRKKKLSPNRVVKEMFSYKAWKYILFGFGYHGSTICVTSPICEECIISKICPSSRVENKLHTYMDTLQAQGHFPEIKKEETSSESEEVDLASCSGSEEEVVSDI